VDIDDLAGGGFAEFFNFKFPMCYNFFEGNWRRKIGYLGKIEN
jgi:hypothetical protein